MSLPQSNSLSYELTVPSTKKKVKYRPFLVKEQKSLLIAQQSEDVGVLVATLKNVIKSCVQTDIDIDKLAIFDLEYIFAQLRAKSTSEMSELLFGCDEDSCIENEKAKVKISIDLTKLEVNIPEGHNKVIPLYGDVGVTMKYPNVDIVTKLENTSGESEAMFEIVMDSIDSVYGKESVYPASEYSREELSEFLDGLTVDDFKKIIEFFNTMPKLEYTVDYNCPECKKKHSKKIEGIMNFF